MSLNVSLLNALSGLQVNQRLLDLAAQNVANVNTEGYARKVGTQATVVLGGEGSGVRLAEVSRIVNEYLLRDLRDQRSFVGQSSALDDFYGRMQDLFGTPGSQGSIGAQVSSLADAFQALAAQPEDASRRTEVVNQAVFLVQQFNALAAQVQSLRREADQGVADAVTTINDRLTQIHEFNLRIARDSALGQPVADLQDARDRAANDIADLMDIRYFLRDSGEMVIFTANGKPLLDRTPNLLSHTAAGAMSPTVSWAAGSVDGIALGGIDITADIAAGRLAGLIALRDATLPDLASQFDELAGTLVEEINALHNLGTSFPGADTLTGTRSFALSDVAAWTGTARIAVLDSTGTVVEVNDINLASITSLTNLVTAIDGMTNVTGALNADGQFVISATGGNKVALAAMDSAIPVGSRSVSFAEFIGINDFFTTGADYSTYTSGQQTSDSTALGLAGTLTFQGGFGTATVNYTVGNDLGDVAAAINADAGLTAAGISASVLVDGSGYRLRIADAGGDNVFVTDSSNLLSTLAVKARGDGVSAALGVRSDLVTDPGQVAHAALSGSAPLGVGDVGVAAGDNSIGQEIANKFNAGIAFGAIGGIPAASRTFTEFGASILALNATQAQSAKSTLDWRESLFETLSNKAASISAVNLDEETANMVLLQNAYAASARVASTTAELFDVLMAISR